MHLGVGEVHKSILHLEAAVMLHHIPVEALAQIHPLDPHDIRNISPVNMNLGIE